MSVQNSEYVYAPVYVIDKYKTAKTGEKVYKLVSDNLYMKVGTDEQLGLQYYIPVPKLGIPGKMIEFGDQSLLETNTPMAYKRKSIPYNNEIEARDYVVSILNGDTDRTEVIESIKKESESNNRGLTTDVLVEMEKKQRTGGMQTIGINSINNTEANDMDNAEMLKLYKEQQASKNRTNNNSEKKCDIT